ncbi:uncharacterized protein LOC34622596 [Cyclospora cayetanensis]|uniref:Uncharacterized protein LOC34622596 n=1 Tax=Cyclospora cayetanensis TaxID=88456 RepID=A0A6P6RVX8_9EIME|nr:uncharacterized protein LOC34622596 [Cyclospora cayetanensis]
MSRQQQQQLQQQQHHHQLLLQQHGLEDGEMTPPVSPVNPSDAQQPADERQQALQCTSQLSPSTPGSSSSQQQQQQQVHHPPPALPDYSLSALPPPSPWEVDFLLPSFLSRYAGSNSGGEPLLDEVPTVYSEWRDTPAVRFRLMVHPVSPTGAAAAGGRDRRFVGAFVETARREDYPEDWIFHQGCRFHIYAIHPTDYRKSIYKSDTYQFSCDDADRGWHQFASHQELVDESFLRASPQGGGGALYLRAGCIPICAAVSRRIRTPCPPATLPSLDASASTSSGSKRQQQQQQLQQQQLQQQQLQLQQQSGGEDSPPLPTHASQGGTPSVAARGMGRCGRGFVGLRNHGATCYMNALLQSLYFIGKFREAVYALSFDTKNTCGTRSVDILERRRCRRKRGRGFAASGVAQAKRGEAPSSAAASAASAGGASGNVSAVKGCNGAATAASSDEQMDVEGMSPSSVFSEGESSLAGGTAAAVLSEESTDSEDELSDLEESELRDLLVEEEAERRSPPSISLALQNLFLKLYTANEAVPYKELIRSFGWDAADAFTQQDTHELLKLLLDKVEEQMRGTPAEGSVKAMFEGEMETYVECINVEYKSVRKEAFEDVNLDVQGCSGVRESLQRLVMPELLEGDNAYDAEQHGKQTARKGVRFVRFPPICVFLLKRFDFDFARMDTVKVFDRYEFQRELDLNEFCEGAGVYALHSVSVHQGDVNSGHYYSFLRPPPGTQWVRFDDDKVYHVSEYAAIGDNFGGEELEACNYLRGERKTRTRNKPYNAYILVYVNKSQAPYLLADCSPLKVNPQILSRCRTEEQLRRLRTHIRNALEKSVRIKVYHPLQFKYRRFVELPYLSIPPIMDIKRSRNSDILLLHETITQELTRLLYGGGGRQGGPAGALGGAPNRVQFVLHLINTSMESPRFEAIELGTNMELGEILRRKGGGGGGGLEVSLYVLAVPEKSALFSTPLQHDEIVRSHCLLFIKYFPSLTRTARDVQLNKGGHLQQHHQQQPLPPPPQQQQQIVQANTDKGTQGELVICLDVVYVPFEWKVRDLEPHVFRLIHEAMQEGLIDEGPSRAAEVARVVSAFPPTLPPLSSCAPYSAPLPVPLPSPQNKGDCYPPLQWSQGASVAVAAAQALGPLTAGVASSLQLTACLELDATDKIHTNRLLGRKTLRNSKVFSGDLLVFSLDLPPALLEYKEAQQKVGGRSEDVAPQQAYCPSSPAEEGHLALEAAAAAAAAVAVAAAATGTAADTTSSLVPWGGAPPREVRGLSLLPFVPRSRGGAIPPIPPPLPCYLCNDFVDYCLEEQATEIYHIRLYDPYEFLGKVMSSSGCLLPSPSLPPPVGEASSLLSEASLVSLPGSDVGAPSNEGAPCVSLPGVPHHPSAENTATLISPNEASTTITGGKSKMDEPDEEALSPSPVVEDPWLHMPSAKPICIKEFSLSGRLPARQALQWIAWQFGVDPTQLQLFPEPPLLSDRKVLPLDIDALVVTNEGTWEQQQQLMLQRNEREGTGRRQLTLDEMYLQLQGAQSWPGCLDRRRALAAATAAAASAAAASAAAASAAASPSAAGAQRLPRELHLCLLPRHFRLCARAVNALLLPAQQQQQLQQLLLSPLPPAALSPSSSPLSHSVLSYICLVFSRQAERIGCVTGLIPASNPDGKAYTAADLMREVLGRLPPATAHALRQDYHSRCSGRSSGSSTAASTGTTADKADKDYEEEFGPLRLFISDSSNLLRIPPAEELSWLTLYAPSSQGRTRESITNLLAVPLRLEADYTPEEEDLIQSGALQVLLVQHQTPGDREPFGYPFEILVEPDATLSEIKAQIIRKLALPKNAWGSCTFFQLGDGVRCWKGPNDVLDWNKHRSITLIAEHSAPYTKHRGHGGMRIA